MFEEQLTEHQFPVHHQHLHHHNNQWTKYYEKCAAATGQTNSPSTSDKTNLSSSYNKEITISDHHSETIMKISELVNDYSTSFHYSNNSSNNSNNNYNSTDSLQSIPSVVLKSSIADLRRVRFKETWDFLNKSDLIEVTLKTADLMKKNQLLQRDIDQLKEEIAKIIPSSKIHDVETADFVLISSEQQA